MDEERRRQIEEQNAAILATPCLVRLAWSVDPKWSDTRGGRRKAKAADAGAKAPKAKQVAEHEADWS